MIAPNWALVFSGWLLSLGAAAGLGAGWEWSGVVFLGVFMFWVTAWASAIVLHGFLVPKETP